MHKLSPFESLVLKAFVAAATKANRSGELAENEFYHLEAHGIAPAIARPVLRGFVNSGVLEVWRPARPPGPLEFLASHSLGSAAERARLDAEWASTPGIWRLTLPGAQLVHAELQASSAAGTVIERDELDWAPLPLEKRDVEIAEALEKTAALADRVRGDNGFASTQPVQHRAILWSLHAGLDALKQRVPSASQVRALLLAPMKWLSENFGKAAVGEMAKEAAKAVLRAVGWIT